MLPDYYVAGSILHTCITMYVGRRRSARSYCVRAHAPGLEQTDDYHRRPCKLCVNWMPEYSDYRSPYSDMHMGPITGLADCKFSSAEHRQIACCACGRDHRAHAKAHLRTHVGLSYLIMADKLLFD